MAKVLITGGSGMVGNRLSALLLAQGYEVSHLGRKAYKRPGGIMVFKWDYTTGFLDQQALEGVDVIVHLAGAGVADKRWTKDRKKEIIDSRVKTAELLYRSLEIDKRNVKAIISASAVGWYGDGGDNWQMEEQASGSGFLAETCSAWEGVILPFKKLGLRECRIRTGVVLSTAGGALPAMDKPIRFGLGAYLGNGKQFVPWIHIDDLCHIFNKAISDHTLRGVYNAVAPNPVTAKELTKEIAIALGRPFIPIPTPSFALRGLMGEMADMVLFSNRVSSNKIQDAGYQFIFSDVHSALLNLYGK